MPGGLDGWVGRLAGWLAGWLGCLAVNLSMYCRDDPVGGMRHVLRSEWPSIIIIIIIVIIINGIPPHRYIWDLLFSNILIIH